MADMRTTNQRTPWIAAIIAGALAELLFLWNLARPAKPVFDEVYYVEAARAIARLYAPYNIEHPMLAKTFMAAGILIFGDNPVGWRFFSTLSGAAIVMGGMAIAWQLSNRLRPALLTAGFLGVNQTLYMQSRLAMLDGFMAAFLVLAVATMLAAARRQWSLGWLILSGALLGAAIGSKWAAVPFLGFAGLSIPLLRWVDRGGARPRRFGSIGTLPAMAALGISAAAVYLLSFAPAFFYKYSPLTLTSLWSEQLRMYLAQTQQPPLHSYQSPWWTWPLDLRPIWYLYEPVDGVWRGVFFVGNPVVFWGGLLAVAACLWIGWRERSRPLLGIAALWIGAFGIWAVVPKKIGFLYYYYPASLFICLALAFALDRARWRWAGEAVLAAAAAVFIYFYPILSAAPLSDDQAFKAYILLPTWP